MTNFSVFNTFKEVKLEMLQLLQNDTEMLQKDDLQNLFKIVVLETSQECHSPDVTSESL